MNIKSNKNKKIVSITTVAALIVLFALLAICTPIQGFTTPGPTNQAPDVSDIPDQTVNAGEPFATINLDDHVTDDDVDSNITWTTSGATDLTIVIDENRVATITYTDGWTGNETITFTATDLGGLSNSDDATFTVNQAPLVSDIPDQTVNAGEPFATINLDDHVTDDDVDSNITWTTSGATDLTIVIDENRVATITYTDGWTGSEIITFTATDLGGLSGSDDATFTVNRAPDVSKAYPSIECLWPPNHKFEFVDITIDGVTDPDGDVITITITGITSDEPTATIEGAGGKVHAPDADGVGTDTASVRAERSGTGDGRVYEITFVASDGKAETVGSVLVCVPHDRKKGTCDCIDDGQNYDATEINE